MSRSSNRKRRTRRRISRPRKKPVQPGYGREAFWWSALTIASISLTAAYVLWKLNTKGHAHLSLAIPMFELILLSISITLIVLRWRSRNR